MEEGGGLRMEDGGEGEEGIGRKQAGLFIIFLGFFYQY